MSEHAVHLSPPPRTVPTVLTVRVVLGGVLSQIGWIFVLFGMVFVWAFDPGSAIVSAVRFGGDVRTAEGIVSGWDETSWTVNERPVYATRYEYSDAEGRPHTGASFATGSYGQAGERVTVEYLAGDAAISRILGMRTTPGGVALAFVYVFPLVGLVLAISGMRRGLKARRLMSGGQLGLGTLVSKEPTSTRVNNQTVYRLTFEFEAPEGGTFQVEGRTHRPYELEDEPQERLVYDPRNPGDAALLDELPCRPGIDGRGDFTASGPRDVPLALLNLVAPALSVLVYLGYRLFG